MLGLVYGAVAYAIFFGTFLYSIAFAAGDAAPALVPRTVDSPVRRGSFAPSLAINLALLSVFAVQHSLMARPAFKRVWTRIVPKHLERSTYVIFASAALSLLYWQWRPLPTVIWRVRGPARGAMLALYEAGWLLVLASTFMLSHWDLFGLRQVWRAYRKDVEAPPDHIERSWLYGFVRHPIMLGFLIAFWAAPTMTVGRLVFALASSGYILVGVRFEEHDMEAAFGDAYRDYRREVPAFVPRLRRAPRIAQSAQ